MIHICNAIIHYSTSLAVRTAPALDRYVLNFDTCAVRLFFSVYCMVGPIEFL